MKTFVLIRNRKHRILFEIFIVDAFSHITLILRFLAPCNVQLNRKTDSGKLS